MAKNPYAEGWPKPSPFPTQEHPAYMARAKQIIAEFLEGDSYWQVNDPKLRGEQYRTCIYAVHYGYATNHVAWSGREPPGQAKIDRGRNLGFAKWANRWQPYQDVYQELIAYCSHLTGQTRGAGAPTGFTTPSGPLSSGGTRGLAALQRSQTQSGDLSVSTGTPGLASLQRPQTQLLSKKRR